MEHIPSSASSVVLVGAECEESLPLRYMHAALDRKGIPCRLVSFNCAGDIESAAGAIAQSGAAVAGLSMVFTYRAREFSALAVRARELGYRGLIVAGGHFAAFNASALLADVAAIDAVAIGEGEGILPDLVASIAHLGRVAGLVWRDGQGDIHVNHPSSPPADLASLPWPTRLEPPDTFLGLPIANMLSSRGCTHSCHFCSISAWHKLCGGASHRIRPVEDLAAEMASLYHRGWRIFNFHDDNFLLRDRQAMHLRLDSLAQSLARLGVGKSALAIKARPDEVDEPLFAKLKAMGLFRVFLGIEAGSTQSLRSLGRSQTLEQNEAALATLRRLNLHVCFNILLFNPDSTLDDLSANVAFMRTHAGNPQNFCRTEVYAGTPLERRLDREGRLTGSYWGMGYRMADPAAQRAFELTHTLLFDRHHAQQNVHHMAMRVDYERQLVGDFFGIAPRLEAECRDYVRRVNSASCDRLDQVVSLVRHAAQPADDWTLAIAAGNAADMLEGPALLRRLAQAASSERHPTNWNKVAAVGVLAGLAVGSAAETFNTHPAEMVPIPWEVDPKPWDPPPTTRPATMPATQPATKPRQVTVLRVNEAREWLKPAVRHMVEDHPLVIQLDTDRDGKVEAVRLYRDRVPGPPQPLNPRREREMEKLIPQLSAEVAGARSEAMKGLLTLGRGVCEPLRKHAEQSADPEVVLLCRQIIAELDSEPVVQNRKGLEEYLKKLVFTVPSQRGVTLQVMVPSAASVLIDHTQIFEMAPAPLD